MYLKTNNKKENSKTNKQTKQNKKEKKRKKGKRRSLAEFEHGAYELNGAFSMELPPANDRGILNRLKKRLEAIG